MAYSPLVIPLAIIVAACAPAGTAGGGTAEVRSASSQTGDFESASRSLDVVADDYWTGLIQAYPLFGVFLGVPETPNDRLGDNSLAATQAWERKEDRWLAQLSAIDPTPLRGHAEEATYGILRETLEAARQTRVCHVEYWPLNQQNGLQIFLPLLSELQPVGTAELRSAALARWRAMPSFIDTEIESLREGLRRGYTLPKANAASVVEQVDDMLEFTPAASPFSGITRRDSAAGFRDSVVNIVAQDITPALRRYREFLVSEYIPHAREATAIAALPNGNECYRARVRSYTTVDRDAQAVHNLGLEEMGRIEADMRKIAERSFGTTNVPQLIERIRSDPQYAFKSREDLIRTAERSVARAKEAMPRWFGRLPKTEFILDPCKPHEEKKGCPNSYVPGTTDGRRPARWRINAGDPTSQPRAGLEGTAFHEGIPGHHLQIALAQERPEAHPVTRYLFFSGFVEGWALYSERLADEMGLYSSDLERFGDLGSQALRAARLVVDPGLHVLGWSRTRAIDYMLAHVPENRTYIESEVDRYIADPGQATAYMIGRIEIERLRGEAEDRLGKGFDIREFHDRVLEQGSIPLGLLRYRIEAWLDPDLRRQGGGRLLTPGGS
jgi:uncharacterized protein (DUF885 family)